MFAAANTLNFVKTPRGVSGFSEILSWFSPISVWSSFRLKAKAWYINIQATACWRCDNVSDSLLCISRHHPFEHGRGYKILIVSIQGSSLTSAKIEIWLFPFHLLPPSPAVDPRRRSEYLRTNGSGWHANPASLQRDEIFDDTHDRSNFVSRMEIHISFNNMPDITQLIVNISVNGNVSPKYQNYCET